MSGIFGIISTDGRPVERAWMDQMQHDLRHRAVDGQGYRLEGGAGIGHCLFCTTPEAKYETSPLSYRHWVVTADARLYDRESLCDALGIAPVERSRQPDSLLIARAYEKWGERCVDHLIGDFAFAIWDRREQTLFCARDHAGVRPFFYLQQDGLFLFSSEIRPLARFEHFQPRLNERKILDFLISTPFSGPHANETCFLGIELLLPARRLIFHSGNINVTKYWKLAPGKEFRLGSDAAYAEATRDLIVTAVRDRIRSDQEVGLLLSGGLDSSSIGCVAARDLAGQNRQIFAASSVLPAHLEGRLRDEKKYMEAVAGVCPNMIVDYVSVPGTGVLEDLEDIFDMVYNPVNSFFYLDNVLDETLARRNVRTVLCGYMGDTTVSYYHYNVLIHLLYRGKLSRAFRFLSRRRTASDCTYWDVVKREIIVPLIPPKLLKSYYRSKNIPTPPSPLENAPIFRNIIPERTVNRIHRQSVRTYFQTNNVHKSIWNTDLNNFNEERSALQSYKGVEHVFPLVDKRIIEFLIGLPAEHLMFNGWHRGLIRFAMDGYLPPEVQWRRNKAPFAPDYFYRLQSSLPEIKRILKQTEKNTLINHWIDRDKIEAAIADLNSHPNILNHDIRWLTVLGFGTILHFILKLV